MGCYLLDPPGASTSSINFIKTIAAESREALSQLLRQHTSDDIASIFSTVGSNSRLATTLFSTLLPVGTSPILRDTKIKNKFVQEISACIHNSDVTTDNEEFFTDMQNFNCRVNTNKSKLSVFWSAAGQFIEMDTCTGAHKRLHAAASEENIINVLYAPNVLSVQ